MGRPHMYTYMRNRMAIYNRITFSNLCTFPWEDMNISVKGIVQVLLVHVNLSLFEVSGIAKSANNDGTKKKKERKKKRKR